MNLRSSSPVSKPRGRDREVLRGEEKSSSLALLLNPLGQKRPVLQKPEAPSLQTGINTKMSSSLETTLSCANGSRGRRVIARKDRIVIFEASLRSTVRTVRQCSSCNHCTLDQSALGRMGVEFFVPRAVTHLGC